MAALLQFTAVAIDKTSSLSFSIGAGETRILKVASQEAKAAAIDMSLGEMLPAQGEILLQGNPLQTARRGGIGFIPAAGGLISNLKTWENVTLPLWYHGRRQTQAVEETVSRWLTELGLDPQEWEKFMASSAARLKPVERKLAGLLRGLVQAPQVLVIDAALFEEVEASQSRIWIAVLEKFVHEADGRAVLVVAHVATLLPWRIIE